MPSDAVSPQVWPAVLTAALDCIIVMDTAGIVREFNPAAERTFGWTRSEAVGRTLSELIVPPELRARHTEGLRRYLSTGIGPVLGKRIEIEGARKDGTRLPVELAIVPFDGGSGPLFAGYLRDLSERVKAQRELERRNDLTRLLQEIPLAASTARDLDQAVAACLDAVRRFMDWPLGHAYFLEADGHLASHGLWSASDPERFLAFRAATERTRFPPGKGLPGRVLESGKPLWLPDVPHDSNFPRNQLVQDHGLKSGFGFPILVGGRPQIVLEFFSAVANEPQPDVLAVLETIGREVGRVVERLAQEAALREANAKLATLATSRQEFLNQASHELGTPLTPLLAQLSLLRGETVSDGVRHRLDIIARNVERMRSLATDLLDAARIDSGRLRVEPKPMDLAQAARTAVEAHADLTADQGVTLAAVAQGSVPAFADAQRVGQVLDNLITNALRFTDRGGHIEVAARSEGDWAVVQVRDNGVGITAEGLEKLFRAFSQVHDRTREVGGTGLGLFICRGIAHASSGTIAASSAGVGRGSTFTLRLPAKSTVAPTT